MELINNGKKGKCDCVVRAISSATGKSWDEVYLSLSELGFELKDMPNSKPVWRKYLEQLGFKKQKMPRRSDNTRYTVEEFSDELCKNALVSVAQHLTYVKDGKLLDTWNCGYASVGNYWTK
jgi:hypothetical protein